MSIFCALQSTELKKSVIAKECVALCTLSSGRGEVAKLKSTIEEVQNPFFSNI